MRDDQGNIIPNAQFPDMKGLTDYIHSLGLKVGIYSSPGPWTCGGCVGSYGYEKQDADMYGEPGRTPNTEAPLILGVAGAGGVSI